MTRSSDWVSGDGSLEGRYDTSFQQSYECESVVPSRFPCGDGFAGSSSEERDVI